MVKKKLEKYLDDLFNEQIILVEEELNNLSYDDYKKKVNNIYIKYSLIKEFNVEIPEEFNNIEQLNYTDFCNTLENKYNNILNGNILKIKINRIYLNNTKTYGFSFLYYLTNNNNNKIYA